MYSSPLPIDVDGDGFLDVVMLSSDGYLYAFDGSSDEQEHMWGNLIGSEAQDRSYGSAAAADIDFDGELEIVIGGQDLWYWVYALELNGDEAPGWEGGVYLDQGAGDAQNAPAVCDSNADGTVDLSFVDSSCVWHMFDGVGHLVQRGVTGSASTDVFSSPAIGDLGQPKPRLGGFGPGPPPQPTVSVPDLVVGSWYTTYNRMQVWAFSTILSEPGYINELGVEGWWITGWPKGRDNPGNHYYAYDSSPAVADLDGNGTLDVAVGCSHHVSPPNHQIVDAPVDVFTTAGPVPAHYYVRPEGNAPAAVTWATGWAFF